MAKVVTTTVVTKEGDSAKAMTCAEAALRYPGTEERHLNRMCLKGQRLKRLHGDNIPPNESEKALFGKKVGKYWYIPVKELDRIFLP